MSFCLSINAGRANPLIVSSINRFLPRGSLLGGATNILQHRCLQSFESETIQQPIQEAFTNIDDYLDKVKDALKPSFRLNVTGRHSKAMMRSLLNKNKAEFDASIRELQLKKRWESAESFLLEHQDTFRQFYDNEEYLRVFKHYPRYNPVAPRIFWKLARGRTYQGKFDRLLADKAPHLVPVFQEALRRLDEDELLKILAFEQPEPLKSQLLACVAKSVAQPTPPKSAGIQPTGTKAESNMLSFLHQRVQDDDQRKLHVVAPVYIRNQRKKTKSRVNDADTILQVESETNLFGQTNELDAMIVEQLPGEKMMIKEVWEAKSTVNPATLHDTLAKKAIMVESIVGTGKLLFITGLRYKLVVGYSFPKIGVYGAAISPARIAAKQLQTAFAEKRLASEPSVVVNEALANGYVTASPDKVIRVIERLQSLAERNGLLLVIE